MGKVDRFEDLEVWKLGREICNDLEGLFKNTALGKRYALLNQMDRSSGSIMDNIAEGFGRGGNLEFRNFLGFARGSCTELRSQLYRAVDKELITQDQFQHLDQKCDKEIAKLGSFIKYLSNTDYKGTKFKKD
jgi:four helix bundle protein